MKANHIMRGAIYCILGILLLYAIFPFTRFYFNKPIYVPFFRRLNVSDELVLIKGEHKRIYPFGYHKDVSYRSLDFKVASVWITGRVNAYRVGTTVIQVKFDGEVEKCKVTVIDISNSSLTLKRGEEKTISIKGTDASVSYESDDENIATVSEQGTIVGIKAGETTVTAKVLGRKLKCEVKVE
ncbi:protein containing cell adhesion domain [Lachnospiraceae bacterium KM106-2]|nr:protein containing cell adhesion domain [Lachnospiraceae bacterium KM106-2]